MPRKIRELIAELEAAGFENRGGKGTHRNFFHPNVAKPVTLSGKAGDDSKKYQERVVKKRRSKNPIHECCLKIYQNRPLVRGR
jgi:predicted RNA binding protein YcfA (HicA-like mRNA interferase family)